MGGNYFNFEINIYIQKYLIILVNKLLNHNQLYNIDEKFAV